MACITLAWLWHALTSHGMVVACLVLSDELDIQIIDDITPCSSGMSLRRLLRLTIEEYDVVLSKQKDWELLFVVVVVDSEGG